MRERENKGMLQQNVSSVSRLAGLHSSRLDSRVLFSRWPAHCPERQPAMVFGSRVFRSKAMCCLCCFCAAKTQKSRMGASYACLLRGNHESRFVGVTFSD